MALSTRYSYFFPSPSSSGTKSSPQWVTASRASRSMTSLANYIGCKYTK